MAETFSRCFFHVDLDAFFASVEQVETPSLKGKPVIISGNPHQRRNVVSTASYEARAYGVHSAMPSIKALELCPNGIFVDHHMKLYSEYSERVMSILNEFTPDVMQLSIDEACLDMTGTEKLFGEPEISAKKIKEKIKKETGLTISIGVASNPYVAKICSEINKPDGLFICKEGKEEALMEKLPLKKVWGVGTKTQEKLNSMGLKKVSDIKNHSKKFLESIFGKATSSFLYNVVRGIEPENFHSKPKSHSLSTETTFEYDLYDRDIIETSLLDLSSQLVTRLLKKNITSYTIQLKIRYEDFSTVNIQNTYETPVLCSSDFYERILKLFDSKYIFGRGIRLLGVGVQNTIPADKIVQPELFENENKKIQNLEKAILAIETKDPKIKIHKARLLHKVKSFFIPMIFLSCFIQLANAQNFNFSENVRPESSNVENQGAGTINDETKLPPKDKKNGTSIFSYSKDDKSVEFTAEGFWNLSLLQKTTATFGYGKDFNISFGIPVFEQEVDLSIWFLLNNHYFIKGAFADKFSKSTFAAGYKGENTVKEILISNRNIIFPDTYSLSDINRSIGGGDNQAPGISASFSKDKWNIDAAVRYDMLMTFDKTFYGKNTVNLLKIPKENFVSGLMLVLPETEIFTHIISIYVESNQGTFSDSANRKYKKLSSSDYMLLPARNQIILSPDSGAAVRDGIKPRILIEFDNDAKSVVGPLLGYYGNPENPGPGYLGKIQKFFGSKINPDEGNKSFIPQISKYSYGKKSGEKSFPDNSPDGKETDGFYVEFDSKNLLLAQNNTGFSPFLASYRYDAGISEIQDVLVASFTSETKCEKYSAGIAETIEMVQNDFFTTKRTYVDVYISDISFSSTGINNENITWSSPEINFPFAQESPETYLGIKSKNDLCVMLKSITQGTRLDIGTKAVNGTVRVYKNGVIDSSAKYNPSTGEVTVSSGVSDSDKIYITWCEDSGSYSTGMISGAAGFKYQILPTLYFDVAAATQWAVNPNLTYAENNKAQGGYATLSSKIAWEEKNISLSNTIGATFELDNVTGNYRISGMDNAKPETAYLTQDAGINLPENFSPVLNPRPDEKKTSIELSKETNCSLPSSTGSLDPKISGYKVPVNYNFSQCTKTLFPGEQLWAAETIAMPANKGTLSSGSKFNFAIKLTDEFINLVSTQNESEIKIYIQLGVTNSTDFEYENSGFIPTWKIFDSSAQDYTDVESHINPTEKEWQTVSVILQDQDRAFFSEEYNARLIITCNKKPDSYYSGAIYIGPYEIVTQGIFTSAQNQFTIFTEQSEPKYKPSTNFNTDKNYSQKINWTINNFPDDGIINISDSKISIIKYFEEVDISSYKTINLNFCYDVSGKKIEEQKIISTSDYSDSFILTLDRDAQNDGQNKALELTIPADEIKNIIEEKPSLIGSGDKIHRLEINRITREVFIDGIKIKAKTLSVNSDVIPTRMKIDINSIVKTNSNDNFYVYENGRFEIDEFYISGSTPKVVLQDQVKAKLTQGNDIKIKDFSIIKDASFNTTADINSTLHTDSAFINKTDISGFANASVTLATIKFTTDVGRAPETKNIITNASHNILTTVPVLNVLSFEEKFSINKDDKSTDKLNSAVLNFSKLKVPLIIKGSTQIKSDSWSVSQDINDSLSLSLGNDSIKYALSVIAKANQKKTNGSQSSRIATDNYFDTWLNASKYQFSFGDSDASKRVVNASIGNTFSFPKINFSPEVTFSQTGNYSANIQTIYSDTTDFKAAFPFKIGNQNFSFSYQKTSSLIQNTARGGDYSTDIAINAKSFERKAWYFASFPIYDLISSDLAKKVLNTMPGAKKQSDLLSTEIAQSVNYNGKYDFSWKRPLFATKYDLFIPTIASLSFARDISTAENISDAYQLKATVGYTSVNIFSKNGSFPFMKWCSSDEYNLSFQCTLKIPRNEISDIRQQYSTYIQANFYKTKDDVLRTAIQFTYQDKNNWNGKATILYKRQTHFSPVLEAVKLFNKDFDYSNLKITRTNAFNTSFYSSLGNATDAKLRQSQTFELSHAIEFQIIKQISINASIQAEFTHTKDEICSLGLTLGLGGKLNF